MSTTERECLIIGCSGAVYSRGLCRKHWQRARKKGELQKYPKIPVTKSCKVLNCREPHHACGYCNNHYRRIQRNGDVIHHRRFDHTTLIVKYNRKKST